MSWQTVIFIISIGFMVFQALIGNYTARFYGNLFGYIVELKFQSAMNQIYYGIILVLVTSVVGTTISFFASTIGFLWRKHLTNNLTKIYFYNNNYFSILLLNSQCDNIDQRIVADSSAYANSLSNFLFGFFSSVAGVISSTIVVRRNLGAITTISLWALPIVSIIIYKLIISPIALSIFEQDKKEGNFRFFHARVRQYCEQIAFFSGGNLEKENGDSLLSDVVTNQKQISRKTFWFNFYLQISTAIPLLVGLLLISNSAWKGIGFFKNATQETLISLIGTAFFYQTNLIVSITNMFGSFSSLSNLAGSSARVGQILEFCDILQNKRDISNGRIEDYEEGIEFKDCKIEAPDGTIILKNLSFEVQRGSNVLIMGPSGCGKSSIFRVLRGLWPFPSGLIKRPPTIGKDGVYYLPQKTYLTTGTLRDQLIYPHHESKMNDKALISILEKVNLKYLLDRYQNPMNNSLKWSKLLSLGECQRIAIARLLYHQPKFAILDEVTSALDSENERIMYQLLSEYKITYLSIGHRPQLKKYHHKVLQIGQKGSFSFGDIEGFTDKISEKEWHVVSSSENVSSPKIDVQKDDIEFIEDDSIITS
eukprot:TRINITY_DN6959_c0_g1_i1.p1 TRINITY_DN6959_c0_g1~~TRINITY_DN6959_c0_g1_i1.p1  ORF type:complete len:593 (-),score=93.51 TRINITY_DN6959_c0_g1_i1:104-1882(-)